MPRDPIFDSAKLSMHKLVEKISDNMERIKNELMNNGYSVLDSIVSTALINENVA